MELASQVHYAHLWAHVEPESSRLILLAALEEFATNGFHGSTTRGIAQRIGMSTGALYVHHRSKADLLYEIARIGHESLFADAKDAAGATTGHIARIRAFVETFASWHARYHTLAAVTQYEDRSMEPGQLKEIRRLRRKFVDFLEDELRRGEEAGVLDVVDRAGTVTAILSMGIDVARWYGAPRSPTPDVIGRLYGELVVRMLSSA